MASQERYRKRRRNPIEIAVVVSVLAFAAYLLYIGPARFFLPRCLGKAELIDFTGLKLPASAVVTNSSIVGIMEITHAKMEMDRADVADFLKALPNANLSKRDIYIQKDGPSWWNIGHPKKFISFDAHPSNRFSSYGLINLDGERAVLYLYKTR